MVIELITKGDVSALAIDLARLVGAAYLLITFLTWVAASDLRHRAQVILARVFCVYESIGVLVGLTIHFDANGDLGRWIAVGFFGVFALGYFWFGFVEGRSEPATGCCGRPPSASHLARRTIRVISGRVAGEHHAGMDVRFMTHEAMARRTPPGGRKGGVVG